MQNKVYKRRERNDGSPFFLLLISPWLANNKVLDSISREYKNEKIFLVSIVFLKVYVFIYILNITK